jgi:hypothetical protein
MRIIVPPVTVGKIVNVGAIAIRYFKQPTL